MHVWTLTWPPSPRAAAPVSSHDTCVVSIHRSAGTESLPVHTYTYIDTWVGRYLQLSSTCLCVLVSSVRALVYVKEGESASPLCMEVESACPSPPLPSRSFLLSAPPCPCQPPSHTLIRTRCRAVPIHQQVLVMELLWCAQPLGFAERIALDLSGGCTPRYGAPLKTRLRPPVSRLASVLPSTSLHQLHQCTSSPVLAYIHVPTYKHGSTCTVNLPVLAYVCWCQACVRSCM